MPPFLVGASQSKDIDRLLEDCLAQLGPIPAQANLGFLYATESLIPDLDGILASLKKRTGLTHWSGTTASAICATGQEFYDHPALAIMVAEFPLDGFKMFSLASRDTAAVEETYGAWLAQHDLHFGVLHGDPAAPATLSAIDSLSSAIPGAFFVGGLSSGTQETRQIADQVVSGGLSGVLFSPQNCVTVGHTQGCTPIASKHTITKSERNVLIELDGRPALDVFNQDIGEVLAKDLQRAAGYIFVGLPVTRSDVGDYLVRNLVGFDSRQKLLAIGELVEEGDEIMFCRRDGNSARADMQRMLEDIKARLPSESPPRGALYYSCLARGRYQFGEDSAELKMIQDGLGDIPLVGFFANGEIYHNRLYGYTGVLTVFT